MADLKDRKIKCIAVDDEPFALKIIEDFCEKIPSVDLLYCFNNPIEAYHYMQSHQPDIVFLDIHMPDISGIKLAETIQKLPFVIFTTAHTRYAVESYNLDAIDYLLKPYDFERFFKAIQKAQKHLLLKSEGNIQQLDSPFITVKVEYNNVNININEILYIESLDNYVKIFLNSKKYHITKLSMKLILSRLPRDLFIRVHKSYSVATNKIDFFTNKQVTIKNMSIPIGRTYLLNFIDVMKKIS